jgi:hypothetical protein
MKGDLNISETAVETESEMGAAAFNALRNPAHLHQILHMNHGIARDGSGSEGRISTLAGGAGRERENRTLSPGI